MAQGGSLGAGGLTKKGQGTRHLYFSRGSILVSSRKGTSFARERALLQLQVLGEVCPPVMMTTTSQQAQHLLRCGSLLEEDNPWMVLLKAEVIVLLDTIQAANMGGEKPGQTSGRHDGSTILCTDQLSEITCCRLIDYTSQIIQRADIGTAKLPLDEASTVQFSFPLRHRFHFAQQPSLRYPTLHCIQCRKPTLLLLQYC